MNKTSILAPLSMTHSVLSTIQYLRNRAGSLICTTRITVWPNDNDLIKTSIYVKGSSPMEVFYIQLSTKSPRIKL
jgi:hypothetical protein